MIVDDLTKVSIPANHKAFIEMISLKNPKKTPDFHQIETKLIRYCSIL